MSLDFRVLRWTRVRWKTWPKSCQDCVLKRGWTKADLAREPYPFFCVHRLDPSTGDQRVCAGDKNKAERFNREQKGGG